MKCNVKCNCNKNGICEVNEYDKCGKHKAYNQALDDVWKLATSKFDEVMDFQDLAKCIGELKEQ